MAVWTSVNWSAKDVWFNKKITKVKDQLEIKLVCNKERRHNDSVDTDINLKQRIQHWRPIPGRFYSNRSLHYPPLLPNFSTNYQPILYLKCVIKSNFCHHTHYCLQNENEHFSTFPYSSIYLPVPHTVLGSYAIDVLSTLAVLKVWKHGPKERNAIFPSQIWLRDELYTWLAPGGNTANKRRRRYQAKCAYYLTRVGFQVDTR